MLVEAERELSRRMMHGTVPAFPPTPSIEIPHHLEGISSDALGDKYGIVAAERGMFMERRVAEVLGVHLKVKEVIKNEKDAKEDTRGHDLTVVFKDESGIAPINIQVKSRRESIANYKNKLSRKLRKFGSTMTVDEWLILDRTIPLNGAVGEEDILYSFVFGIGNILKNEARVRSKHRYIELFPAAA